MLSNLTVIILQTQTELSNIENQATQAGVDKFNTAYLRNIIIAISIGIVIYFLKKNKPDKN